MNISDHITKNDNGQFIINTVTKDEERFIDSIIIAYQSFMRSYYPKNSLEDVYIPKTIDRCMDSSDHELNPSQSTND